MARPGPGDAYETIREFTPDDQSEGSITLDLHDGGQWDDLSADARAEEGRGQDPFRIRFEATIEDADDPEPVVIEQDQGEEGEFSVIRQEYEDVVSDEGADGRDDAGIMPDVDDFNIGAVSIPFAEGSGSFLDQLPDPDDNHDAYIHNRNMIQGLHDAWQEAQNRGFGPPQQNPAFDFYLINSHYRSPTENRETTSSAGGTLNRGVGNSFHIYGQAADFQVRSNIPDTFPAIHHYQTLFPGRRFDSLEGLEHLLTNFGGAQDTLREPTDAADTEQRILHVVWPGIR